MKKGDFIAKFAEKINQTQAATNIIVDEFCDLVAKIIKSGDEVVLPELGKFLAKKKPARKARSPITGKEVKVPAKVVPQFKASKKFKDAVAS